MAQPVPLNPEQHGNTRIRDEIDFQKIGIEGSGARQVDKPRFVVLPAVGRRHIGANIRLGTGACKGTDIAGRQDHPLI